MDITNPEVNENLDSLIDWDLVNLNDPNLDICYENIQKDIQNITELLSHLDSGNSKLNYDEIETYKEKLIESLEESKIMKYLLEKALFVRSTVA